MGGGTHWGLGPKGELHVSILGTKSVQVEIPILLRAHLVYIKLPDRGALALLGVEVCQSLIHVFVLLQVLRVFEIRPSRSPAVMTAISMNSRTSGLTQCHIGGSRISSQSSCCPLTP